MMRSSYPLVPVLALLLISSSEVTSNVFCPSLVTTGATKALAIHWTNGGSTDEFNDVANWATAYNPGYQYADTMKVLAGDTVGISCDTSYVTGSTKLIQRSGSRINVYSSLGIGDWYTMWNNAFLTLNSNSTYSVGNYLTATANSHISLKDFSELTVTNALSMTDSDLTVEGGTIQAGSLSFTSTTVDVLGPGSSSIAASGALAFTGSSWAVAGNSDIQVQADSISFNTAQITGDISIQAGSLALDSTTVDMVLDATGFQSWNVAGSFTATNSQINIDAGSYYVPQAGGQAIPLIVSASTASTASFGAQDIVLSGMPGVYDTQVVIDGNGVTLEQLPTPPPADLVTGQVTLDVSSGVPVGTSGNLQIDAGATLVLDGTSYTAPVQLPETIVLYDATVARNGHTRAYSIDGTFDAVKVRNFPEGLWFELKYEASQILLKIKALNDYEDYVARGGFWLDEYDSADLSFWGNTFSWDKVPTWRNARKNSYVTEEELDILAGHSIVLCGISPSGLGDNEAGGSDTARRIKEKGTGTKVLWYWNSENAWSNYRAYDPGYPGIGPFNWDEWAEKDPVTGEFLCDGFNCSRRYYNQTVPEMRQWWIDSAMYFLKSVEGQHYDGIFIDSVAWMAPDIYPEHYQMVQDLGAALAAEPLTQNMLYVGNALRQNQHNGARDKLHFFDASYMENWKSANGNQAQSEAYTVTIQLAREALAAGRIIMLNSGPWGGDATTEQEMMDGLPNNLAIFLMMAEENAYLHYAKYPLITTPTWHWDTSHFPLLNQALGPPLGPPILIGTVMSRDFQYLSVQMDLEAEISSFQWVTPP